MPIYKYLDDVSTNCNHYTITKSTVTPPNDSKHNTRDTFILEVLLAKCVVHILTIYIRNLCTIQRIARNNLEPIYLLTVS